tara:strand:+ start:99 stop:410 length:312 start_codon:yes stop_codon:yes gene_type:complete
MTINKNKDYILIRSDYESNLKKFKKLDYAHQLVNGDDYFELYSNKAIKIFNLLVYGVNCKSSAVVSSYLFSKDTLKELLKEFKTFKGIKLKNYHSSVLASYCE